MIDVAIDRARKHYESLGYTKILLDLEELYSTRGEILLDAENYEDAERLAHNLHGVAGSFGATRL